MCIIAKGSDWIFFQLRKEKWRFPDARQTVLCAKHSKQGQGDVKYPHHFVIVHKSFIKLSVSGNIFFAPFLYAPSNVFDEAGSLELPLLVNQHLFSSQNSLTS